LAFFTGKSMDNYMGHQQNREREDGKKKGIFL